jgi:glycosyltransferase involved in cell wall biosynthesis
MTKISVVTPVYNGARYFDRAAPSILAQSMSDFEWVIVDDGSTDTTPERLAALAASDARVRVLSPGRLGYARALNHAIEQARGAYIANQDFDDRSYRDRLRLQAAFLDAHPEVGVVGGRYVLIDETRDERYERMPPEQHDQIVRAMASRIPFAHTLVMFRKEAWHQAGGYPTLESLVDFRLWIEFGRLGWRFANLPEVLGEHVVYAQSHFLSNLKYRARQRSLAKLQMLAIRTFGLPLWTSIFPAGRYVYWAMPDGMKRAVRRLLAGSRERNLSEPSARQVML